MKRISIFRKEFYIFSAQEHEDALTHFCGVDAGLDSLISQKWIEEHVLSEGHIIDNTDLSALRTILFGIDFSRRRLKPLKKAIGWSTQEILES